MSHLSKSNFINILIIKILILFTKNKLLVKSAVMTYNIYDKLLLTVKTIDLLKIFQNILKQFFFENI